MSIRDFWQQQPDEQQTFLKTANLAELEAYAEEHELLVYEGKLVKPEDYPCDCELAAPDHCYQDTSQADPTHVWTDEEQEDDQCYCPCHRYYEPW